MSDLEERLSGKIGNSKPRPVYDELIDTRPPRDARRKMKRFIDEYKTQTFYVHNDVWERLSVYIISRGDRTAIINEALEDYIAKRERGEK